MGEEGFDPADFEGFLGLTFGGLLGRQSFVGFGEDGDDHVFERALQVGGDYFGFFGGVEGGLQGVALGVEGRVGVLDYEIMLGQLLEVFLDLGDQLGAGGKVVAVPCQGTFHLVEDGVVAAVDGVSAVDIC